jgi:hypothetical protein
MYRKYNYKHVLVLVCSAGCLATKLTTDESGKQLLRCLSKEGRLWRLKEDMGASDTNNDAGGVLAGLLWAEKLTAGRS